MGILRKPLRGHIGQKGLLVAIAVVVVVKIIIKDGKQKWSLV